MLLVDRSIPYIYSCPASAVTVAWDSVGPTGSTDGTFVALTVGWKMKHSNMGHQFNDCILNIYIYIHVHVPQKAKDTRGEPTRRVCRGVAAGSTLTRFLTSSSGRMGGTVHLMLIIYIYR